MCTLKFFKFELANGRQSDQTAQYASTRTSFIIGPDSGHLRDHQNPFNPGQKKFKTRRAFNKGLKGKQKLVQGMEWCK